MHIKITSGYKMNDLDAFPSSALRLLIALEDCGSLTEAARRCGVSQPAASKAIARLEEQTSFGLIRRDHRPVTLTAEGLIVADYARHQHEMTQDLKRQLWEVKNQGSGLVRIASFGASASTHILPSLIASARQSRPMLQVEISESTDQLSLQAVRDGRAEFAISVDEDLPGFEMVPLARDRLVALMKRDDPLAEAKQVDAQTLLMRDFILTKGGSEPLVRAWFAKAGLEPDVKHNIQQITSILAMVRTGMGVSIIAEMAMPSSHQDVAVVPLFPEMPRSINLVRKEGSFASRAAELFWNIAMAKRLGAE